MSGPEAASCWMKSSAPSLPPSPTSPPFPLPLAPSSLPSCPELDLSITGSPAPPKGQSHLKLHPQGQARRKRNAQRVVMVTEPEIPLSSDERPLEPMSSQRRTTAHHHGGCPRAVSNECPCGLGGAEPNTSLALRAELLALQEAKFNAHKVLKETLERSERTKNLINSRATEGVNVSRSHLLFTSLVSVNMQDDQLISQVLQDRLLLAPPPRSPDTKAAGSPSPSLFLTSDLLRQRPLPPEEDSIRNPPRPSPCPASSTFDLYRRQRRWEATP